ncbi:MULTISPECIES: sn-glycerol-3-phosphate ABC transporter ATP-binding protein UgpC [unclassified Rhizobium]|jgi:ABC-type sugar transport system ATPase subunit|uniref:ABC transporter ATP-binding protein n=1 Tax=unclassified Rhizobium TaxID=2613769 RepID=UPI000691DA8F|nr:MULTISPECIES: sn-glycerol-3-phosphate ABC transporter ATP-binding protein UgpC [unclassified Rhizobium]OJY74479.1 MAG: ABC transporter ATP-binding protein [Rhizobium sp. 60-20]RKD67918.1 multiple sugar transport system ATP-binding protein [Rhizobium sp. WW_1]
MADLSLTNVRKAFGALTVLHGIDLTIEDGELVVFVGPSGCGKSTLLRAIAGLEEISGGDIRIGGDIVNHVAPADRQIAMVFQSYALYPHMDVYRNMAFGLKFAKIPKDEIDRRVRKAASILKLDAVLDRKPGALSGGQRQRVAIGRAIVRQPKIFLFDEPLSNLDAALRVNTRIEIAKLHRELGATMIYVTHDQVEAMTLADKIVVLNGGRVEQVGTPLDLYHAPANLFVAGFIGSPAMNLIQARVISLGNGALRLSVGEQQVNIPYSGPAIAAGAPITIGIRPEHWIPGEGQSMKIEGTVDLVEHLGETSIIYMRLADGQMLTVRYPGDIFCKAGDRFVAEAPVAAVHLFNDAGQAMLGRRSSPAYGILGHEFRAR